MKLKSKSGEHSAEEKLCVQITEFKYSEGLRSRKKKSNIEIVESHPLKVISWQMKILAHKLSLASDSNFQNKINSNKEPTSEEIKVVDYIEEIRRMMTPRDALFQPRRSIFNRYNY